MNVCSKDENQKQNLKFSMDYYNYGSYYFENKN